MGNAFAKRCHRLMNRPAMEGLRIWAPQRNPEVTISWQSDALLYVCHVLWSKRRLRPSPEEVFLAVRDRLGGDWSELLADSVSKVGDSNIVRM